jgi:hypothetical protein
MSTAPDQIQEYQAKETRYEQLRAEILPHNKTALFDALAAAGIACVIVTFDGYGDEGQFQGVTGYGADTEPGTSEGIEVPGVAVPMHLVSFQTGEITEEEKPLPEAIEEMVNDFLEATHDGWEVGEGAFGEFRLTVADRSITLEYNERYVETTYAEHSF